MDLKAIVDAVKRVEGMLETDWGATGRGLHEKLDSVATLVPARLHGTLRYLASVRNKAMHEEGYEIDDPAYFLSRAQWVVDELSLAAAAARQTQAPASPEMVATLPAAGAAQRGLPTSVTLAFVSGAFAMFLLQRCVDAGIVARTPVPAPTQAQANAPVAVAVRPVMPAAPFTSGAFVGPSVADKGSPTRQVHEPPRRAAKPSDKPIVEAPASGSSGVGNTALRVDRVEVVLAKGAFRTAPHVTATVTNVSGRTLSVAHADIEIFIGNSTMPAAASKHRALWLGERGLAAGSTVRATIAFDSLFDDAWQTPDILNARVHRVNLRVTKTLDGSRRPTDSPATASRP